MREISFYDWARPLDLATDIKEETEFPISLCYRGQKFVFREQVELLQFVYGMLAAVDFYEGLPKDTGERRALEDMGHSSHCAARMVWGDGECECELRIKKFKDSLLT